MVSDSSLDAARFKSPAARNRAARRRESGSFGPTTARSVAIFSALVKSEGIVATMARRLKASGH